jgi:hypothetical protein
MEDAMKNYEISTDSGQQEIEAENIADAIAEFGECPEWVKTAEDFEEWLEGIGGYGFIREDDIEIARVRI